MAEVTETRVLPAEFIEAGGKTYLDDLTKAVGKYKGADLSKVFGPQFVAGMDPLTQQAQGLATAGIGAYKPYMAQAEAYAAPTGYQDFMSPYKKDVIDATMSEYDLQSARGIPSLKHKAITGGAFGGGREGVQMSEYQSTSDKNRAALHAQLLQGGFTEASNLAQKGVTNQMNFAGAYPNMLGKDVAGLQAFGGMNQAQVQAQLQAQQQLGQQQLNQPLTAANQFGAGVTGLIAGYPGQTTSTTAPGPNPLATILGAGTTLAGLYRAFPGG